MKSSEAILILKGLSPDHEVRLDIGVHHREVTPSTPIPVPNAVPIPTTVWDHNTREWVIGKQFWPNYTPNVVPYNTDITCKNIQPCSSMVH